MRFEKPFSSPQNSSCPPNGSSGNRRGTPNIWGGIRRLIAVLVIGYVLWFLFKNKTNLSSLRNLSIPTLALLFGLSILSSILYALRFRQVVRQKTGLPIPYGSWLRFFLVSRLFSLMAGQTGTLYRIWILKREYGVPISRFLAAALFLTWFDTCLFLLLTAFITAFRAPHLNLFGYPAWGWSAAAWLVFAPAPWLADTLLSMFRFSNPWFSWIHHQFLEITSAFSTAFKKPFFLFSLAANGLLSFGLFGAAVFFCFRGLGLPIDVSGTALFVAILGLSNRIVITPGGNLGIKELAYGVLSEQLHIGMTEGILVSLLSRMITIVTAVALGLLAGGWHLLNSSSGRPRD